MIRPTAPIPHDRIVDREVDRLLRELITRRAVVAPMLAVFVLAILWVDDAPWRRLVLLTMLVLVVGGSVWSRRRILATGGAARAEVAFSFIVTGPLQLLGITATGGLDSPLLVALPPFLVISSVLMGRGPWLGVVLGLELLWVFVLTASQATGSLSVLDMAAYGELSPTHRWLAGLMLMVAMLIATGVGRVIRGGLEAMVVTALSLRDQQLHALLDQTHDLEVAGGELAHELKNPLASIQGLSTLLARELTSEKGQQRMDVLLGEVGRMSEVIEEFLTYSRPLTPLTVVAFDARAVAARVVDLHEGVAASRGLRVVLEGASVGARGDTRKLEQALVNLVQNALSVTPVGGVVELDVQAFGQGVAFEVRDRGPGIPEGLEEQVFRAGVTTREGGSGLGLTVARTLIRQHEGELRLLPREGGGLVARVELP